MANRNRPELGCYHRELPAEIRAAEGEDGVIELSFSSEAPYERIFGPEILDHNKKSVRLKRLKDVGCVLFNHDRDRVIAGIKRVWLGDDGKCHAKIRFDEDEPSQIIKKKVESGTLKGVSVGYQVYDWEEVGKNAKSTDGKYKGPCWVARDWEPYEFSIVSVPADTTVGVGRSLENGNRQGRSLDWFVRQSDINKATFKQEERP